MTARKQQNDERIKKEKDDVVLFQTSGLRGSATISREQYQAADKERPSLSQPTGKPICEWPFLAIIMQYGWPSTGVIATVAMEGVCLDCGGLWRE